MNCVTIIMNVLIFDVDGTLVDSSKGIIKSVKETLNSLSMPDIPEPAIHNMIGPPIDESIGKYLNLNEENRKQFKHEFRRIYYSKYLYEAQLYTEIEKILNELSKTYILTIATNKERNNTIRLLSELKVAQFFRIVEGSANDRLYLKSEMISNILKELNVPPKDAIMIGDSISDFEAAKKNGVSFIGADYGYGNLSDCIHEKMAEKPSDFVKLLKVSN